MFTLKNKTKIFKMVLAFIASAQCQINYCMNSKNSNEDELVIKNDKQKKIDIFVAIEKGNLKEVIASVDQGTNVNQQTIFGITPLHIACSQVKYNPIFLEIIEYLLSKGAKIDQTDNQTMTPLVYAANTGHLEIVKYLLNKGADIKKSQLALFYAASEGYVAMVKFLHDQGANLFSVTGIGLNSLIVAAIRGHLEIVQYLLANMIREETKNKKNDKYHILFNINQKTNQNLILKSQGKPITLLLGSTLLHIACLSNNEKMIKKILLFKPDQTITDQNGKKAIDYVSNYTKLYNLMSHTNCHRPTKDEKNNDEDIEFYNRAVLNGADNQEGKNKAFVHAPIKYNDSDIFDLSFNYLEN